MHMSGIDMSQIMGFMTGQAGGYVGVGFSKKDLYNYIDRSRQARILDGDANAAISYLQGKADAQPLLVAKYSSIVDDKLGNLFWADGVSRVDYQTFGDVVGFDATYKKNKYNRPLVIFSGTNHHRQTSIFGFALLGDECTSTYKWLLENFLDVMMGKEPSVVVTDGDKAMWEAIWVVFPNATHRLCGWHLQKNAKTNLKSSGFCEALKTLIYGNLEVELFEELWKENVRLYGLEQNEWVNNLYQIKEMWVTAYLRDKFCGGYRTTSRCEGINSFIKRFVGSRQSILDLVQNLDRAVAAYRNNELEAQFKSIYGDPVLTTRLAGVDCSATSLYTREIFLDVKKQIEKVISLIVIGTERIGTTIMYKVGKYGRPGRDYIVLFDKNLDKYECTYQMWNGYGIPCRHLFCVMKHEHVLELPKSLVLKRWCKDAKTYIVNVVGDEDDDSEMKALLRYGALAFASQWMSYLGSRRQLFFRETMEQVCRISEKLEKKCCFRDPGPLCVKDKKIGDPTIVRSKGALRCKKEVFKKRKCSNCNMVGHSKRTCSTICSSSSRSNDDDFDLPYESGDGLSNTGAGSNEPLDVNELPDGLKVAFKGGVPDLELGQDLRVTSQSPMDRLHADRSDKRTHCIPQHFGVYNDASSVQFSGSIHNQIFPEPGRMGFCEMLRNVEDKFWKDANN